jgi:hypothetical protein
MVEVSHISHTWIPLRKASLFEGFCLVAAKENKEFLELLG